VGRIGVYDIALAETIIGLYKADVIRPNGTWSIIEEVEFATLEWVDWFQTGDCSARSATSRRRSSRRCIKKGTRVKPGRGRTQPKQPSENRQWFNIERIGE